MGQPRPWRHQGADNTPWGGTLQYPVPAVHVDCELVARVENVATWVAPPASIGRETGEDAGTAAPVEAGGGKIYIYIGGGRNTDFRFYIAAVSFPDWTCS